MKKMYFIVNLIAGKAVIAKKLGRIIDEFVKADYEVTVHTTQSSEDAVKATQYACGAGFDLIVCAGGDGTLSNCLQALMRSEKKLPLGYIPAGTTNDFAKGLKEGIAAGDDAKKMAGPIRSSVVPHRSAGVFATMNESNGWRRPSASRSRSGAV